MHDLTERQIQILKALIEEYIETAEAVGSEKLEKKYSLSASPATIRNEMVRLSELGYLKKTHTSAGRVPTPLGMRFYVKQLMEKKALSVTEEVSLKEKVWDYREQEHQFLKEVTKCLASRTGALAVALTEEGRIYVSGYANILNMPEFYEIKVMQDFLKTLDEFDYFHKYLTTMQGDEETYILMGEELGPQMAGPYGFVFSRYTTLGHLTGEIGVLGPTRLNYTSVVPMVRYFGGLIEEIAKW